MSERLDDYPYDVAELVRKAELDYLTVQQLDLPVLAEIICFHCQQCAEKYLKALISFHGDVPSGRTTSWCCMPAQQPICHPQTICCRSSRS